MLIQDQETASLLETKFELMLNMNYQRTKKEIDTLKQQIEALSQELQSVKRTPVARREEQTTLYSHEVPQPEQPIRTTAQQISPQASQPQKQETQPRSRTGNFTHEEVSIEKMFYFGGKR